MLGASCSPAMHLKELGLPFPVKFFWALGGAAWVSPQPSLFQKEAARLPQPLPLLIAWPLKSSHGAQHVSCTEGPKTRHCAPDAA